MSYKILLVDDMKIMRNVLKLNLKRLGYTISEANNGEEALEVAEKVKPDLVIADIMMPKMDGFTFLKLFRLTKDFEKVPVIMLTAKEDKESVMKAIKLGANDFIVKPYETAETLEKIKKLLN